jgi:tRNA A-37 threonylcarbamoyl transferase component Bud32
MPKQLSSLIILMIIISRRSQIYKLVQELHRIGIAHGDLEPRNIGRTREGGFYLIDFSESRRHICKESKV